MRVLFWYCKRFAWTPARQTIDDAAPAARGVSTDAVVAFVHVEPADEQAASKVETKLVKNAKWLAGKWDTQRVVLHSFTHLAEEKAAPDVALGILRRACHRLEQVDYEVCVTPYGYFNDLQVDAPGHPLARVFKQL